MLAVLPQQSGVGARAIMRSVLSPNSSLSFISIFLYRHFLHLRHRLTLPQRQQQFSFKQAPAFSTETGPTAAGVCFLARRFLPPLLPRPRRLPEREAPAKQFSLLSAVPFLSTSATRTTPSMAGQENLSPVTWRL